MEEKLRTLKALLGQAADLEKAESVLIWDQRTYMPSSGNPARARQRALLSRMAHEIFTSDQVGRLLEELEPLADDWDDDSDEASLVRVAHHEYQKLTRVPADLVAERSQAHSVATEVWKKARAESDFALLQPHLERIVELSLAYAEALGYEDRLYDALLDRFEPHMKTDRVAQVFEELKQGLVPLVQEIAAHQDRVDDVVFDQTFPADQQWAFGLEVLRDIGFDFARGRQDRTAHPFTISFSPNDVRLTTRVFEDNFKSALFGSIHEAGHGMYEQGISPTLAPSLLFNGASLGLHESQSRLWENVIGRSRSFWRFYFPRLKGYFPQQLAGVDVEGFYRAINKVEPSFIRVEADEVTYNLHIFIRFELELDLLEGRLRVADLPEAWNAKMAAYLGIVPPDDGVGVLQDVHWPAGNFGYFPTYALGNLLSLQFFNRALADMPDLPAQIEAGDFTALHRWLREKIYVHGRKYRPAELVRRVTGTDMQAGPFLDYARKKYGEIYGL